MEEQRPLEVGATMVGMGEEKKTLLCYVRMKRRKKEIKQNYFNLKINFGYIVIEKIMCSHY